MSINYGSTAVIIPFAEAVSLRSRRSLRNAMRTAALLPSALSVLITIRRHFYLQLLLINPLLENSELNFFGFSALTKLLKNIIARGCDLAVITEVLLNVFFPNQPEFPTVKGPWQEIKQSPGAPHPQPLLAAPPWHITGHRRCSFGPWEQDEVGQMSLPPPTY